MSQPPPLERTPEQQKIIDALDSLLTERVPAKPAPPGIGRPAPLDPPWLRKSQSNSSTD